jgi:hypothetical protein
MPHDPVDRARAIRSRRRPATRNLRNGCSRDRQRIQCTSGACSRWRPTRTRAWRPFRRRTTPRASGAQPELLSAAQAIARPSHQRARGLEPKAAAGFQLQHICFAPRDPHRRGAHAQHMHVSRAGAEHFLTVRVDEHAAQVIGERERGDGRVALAFPDRQARRSAPAPRSHRARGRLRHACDREAAPGAGAVVLAERVQLF